MYPNPLFNGDVPAILHGNVPQAATPLQEPPEFSSNVFGDAVIKSIMETMRSKFKRVSEMDVVVRVFLMLLIAVSDYSGDIKIELEPSVSGHSTFTDFLISIIASGEKWFIEVKRTSISTDLSSETEETAQALREAQILLCTEKVKSPVQFLLTNGTTWSFGSATRDSDTKIKLTHVWNMSCNIGTVHDWKMMIAHLKLFLCGTFPFSAAQPEV